MQNISFNKLDLKKNRFDSANLFSKWIFWWTFDIFSRGNKKDLQPNDLYKNRKCLDSKTISDKFDKLWELEEKSKSPNLYRLIFRAYGLHYSILTFFFLIVESGARIAMPLFLGGIISHFAETDKNSTNYYNGYLYGSGIIICALIPVIVFHPYMYHVYHVGFKVRLGLTGLMYKKLLKLSKYSNSSDDLNSRAINIMSNDLNRIDMTAVYVHDLIKGPIEAAIVGYLLYREIGISGMFGFCIILLCVPCYGYGAKKVATFRKKTAKCADYRIKIMNEIIQGIQVIKMYAWESSFGRIIHEARIKEMQEIRNATTYYATIFDANAVVSKISTFLSLVSYAVLVNKITAQKVFTVSALFNVFNGSMLQYWPTAVAVAAEAKVILSRVKSFMVEQERDNKKENYLIVNDQEPFISFEQTSLANIDKVFDLTIKDKTHVGVIGPVGSGKTLVLSAILGELAVNCGKITVSGHVSYASQDPWLFEGTIQDNIVFVEKFEKDRYNQVLEVCALEKDIELFPQRDLTVVGERGISLSGGQKARVNLARAIYRQADIYLLDDPLSAVDAHVRRHIYDKCIKNFLSQKICILVTHQLQYIKNLDTLIFLNSDGLEIYDSYEKLKASETFAELIQNLPTDEAATGDTEQKEATTSKKQTKQQDIKEDLNDERKEEQQTGSVKYSTYKSYFKNLKSWTWFFITMFSFILLRILLSGIDYLVSRWSNWEENIGYGLSFQLDIMDERNIILIIYTCLIGASFVMIFIRNFLLFLMCIRISLNLHQNLYNGVVNTKMSFFNWNSSGRILNRFSRDIYSIDIVLPGSLIDSLYLIVDVIGVIVIVAIANYWLIIPAIVVTILFYKLRSFCLKTSRSIKRIEALTRSPICSHINQTYQGLITIRSLKAENELKSQFHQVQDVNMSAWSLYISTNRAFALWLDFFCVIYLSIVIFSFLLFEDQFSSGDVGLAILQSMTLITSCQTGIRQTAELENNMVSVERILEYSDLPSEHQSSNDSLKEIPENWASTGSIKFHKFYLRYTEDSKLILKNLNFIIEPKEKIGIVGRTGAGKSSIIQGIFRLACNEGLIEIDGLDIGKIDLVTLRSRISIIPQDPVLFSGTIRYNLDPFETTTDSEIWNALDNVKLKTHVSNLVNGLHSRIAEGGSNFSTGQKQLICLARAIIKQNKILILDEATANIDPGTDDLIQKTIRSKFSDCTVLTIAHRLNTIMDSDKIIVMDDGKVVEIGAPGDLLKQPNSYFAALHFNKME